MEQNDSSLGDLLRHSGSRQLIGRHPDVALFLAASLAFLLISWSPYHYWDEFFYLFSAYTHTPRELIGHETGLGIFPNGFFSGKIAHLVLLRELLAVLGPGRLSLSIIQLAYALMMLAFARAAWGLLGELVDKRLALRASIVLLALPVTTYLGFKTLSEVPSLLFTTLGCWAFVRSLGESSGARRGRLLLLASTGVSLGALSRVTGVLEFAGLALGLIAARDPRFRAGDVARRAAGVLAVSLLIYAAVQHQMGGSPFSFTDLAYQVATRPNAGMQRLYALVLALQAFALILPWGFRWRHRHLARLMAVWLGVAAVPFLTGHEPRYYASALIPLAAICATGITRIADRVLGLERSWGWLAVLGLLVLVDRVLFVPLMPYEVDQSRLNAVMDKLERTAPGGTYLVPWISDYAYLRIAFPDRRVRLSISAIPGTRYTARGHSGPMLLEDQWWAGAERYIGSPLGLSREPRPWYYIGWSYGPSLLQLRQSLALVGVHWADDPKRAGWHNHLVGSWIWWAPQLSLTPEQREGQYQVFRVRAADSSE